jgi:pyrimidine operon attenuation protein / uracil phosphoribosyltransferase
MPDVRNQARAVLEGPDIHRALTRIAHEILERTKGAESVVLLGIPTRGVTLAHRIGERLEQFEGIKVPVGAIDVTMYRDDLRLKPARPLGHTDLPPGGIDGKIVVLVDDVLFSGRTVRAALDALNDVGRPRGVQLATLVDRGHRELPIRADYVGKNLPTAKSERVKVFLEEIDGRDAVLLMRAPNNAPGSAADSAVDSAPDNAADNAADKPENEERDRTP